MWFDEDLKSAYEIGFQVGILNAGYDPVRVDQVGVSSRNGKNRTLSHQKQLASALNRRVCEVSVPTLTTPFGVRGFPLPPG